MEFDPNLAMQPSANVYPPSEDSHLLLRAVEVQPGERMLEMGAGAALVALHAAKVARVVATDVSPHVVRRAARNAPKNGLPVAVVRRDLFRGLRGTFDVIAFNPPYLIELIGGGWAKRA